MNRLPSEWRRLYAPTVPGSDATAQADLIDGTQLVDAQGRVRALVLQLGRPADWRALSRLWQGVQLDLAWPAPAIAVSGKDGHQLWFSLAQPVPVAQARALLTAERTALNFLQLLSAVATKTAIYVDAVNAVPNNRAQIVDTRKTIPGLRLAQKYAVKIGGGTNHRIGLYDAVLIKENHIAAAGSITQVLEKAAHIAPHAIFIEIEVENLEQLAEALNAGAKMVLLDNMDLDTLRKAVELNAGRAILEVSGGVNLSTVAGIAATGVDRISIGALTKDVEAIDFSMRFEGV